MCMKSMGNIAILMAITALLAIPLSSWVMAQGAAPEKSYLDYLDSYYQTYSIEDLNRARASIKSDLDSSLALRFQGYYYHTEIEYLLSLEDLKKDPHNIDKQQKLRGLLLQLYGRYLDAYSKVDPAELAKSNIPGNTAFLFKDILMATTFLPNANSCAPLVKNLLRRANRDGLHNKENSFVASVNDMLEPEYPNIFGVSNLVKAVWLNDKFMSIKEETPEKRDLREKVNYYASVAADTLTTDYGKTIAYFLLGETYANWKNDMGWDYFRKCINLCYESKIEPEGFYARNYNSEVYLATAVAFYPAYSEYLFENGRYAEIVDAARYLTNLGMLDRGKNENVTKEVIFWGEKSIRELQDTGSYESADRLFRELQGFYELLKPQGEYGTTE